MRNPEVNLVKNLVAFQTYMKLVDNALKSAKTGSKKLLLEMKDKLETLYFSLVETHHFHKADTVAKECSTVEEFNALKEVGSNSFQYNDT